MNAGASPQCEQELGEYIEDWILDQEGRTEIWIKEFMDMGSFFKVIVFKTVARTQEMVQIHHYNGF